MGGRRCARCCPARTWPAGYERSVDAYGVDAADWERDTLGPGNRVGGDVTSVSLASTYGRQDPVREVGALYYADPWTLARRRRWWTQLHVDYLVVDRRLSTQLPAERGVLRERPAGRPDHRAADRRPSSASSTR